MQLQNSFSVFRDIFRCLHLLQICQKGSVIQSQITLNISEIMLSKPAALTFSNHGWAQFSIVVQKNQLVDPLDNRIHYE